MFLNAFKNIHDQLSKQFGDMEEKNDDHSKSKIYINPDSIPGAGCSQISTYYEFLKTVRMFN